MLVYIFVYYIVLICNRRIAMTSRTVRVNQETWEALHELSKRRKEPMQSILAHAVEGLRRQYILEETNAVYAELRAQS
jgi:predicted transcriptional regulator